MMFFENIENNIKISAVNNKINDEVLFSEKFKLNSEKSVLLIRNKTQEITIKLKTKKVFEMFLICIGFLTKKPIPKIPERIKGKNIERFSIIFFIFSIISSIVFSKKHNKYCKNNNKCYYDKNIFECFKAFISYVF